MRTLATLSMLALFALPAAFAQTFVDLSNGVPVMGTAIADNPSDDDPTLHTTQYRITVPPGATQLVVTLDFSEQDVDLDLYLNVGSQVSLQVAPYAWSVFAGVDESITLTPQTDPPLIPGVHYIAIGNWDAVTAPFTLTATHNGAGQPDLLVSNISLTAFTATEGQPFFIAPIVSNAGTGDAGASHLRLFLSTDNDFDPADDFEVLPEMAVPGLAAGATNQPRWDFNFPDLGSAPTYPVWIVVAADSQNEVVESDENNNVAKSNDAITVSNGVAQSPTPTRTPTQTRTPTRTPTFTPTPTLPGPARHVVLDAVEGPAGFTTVMNVSLSDLTGVAGLYLDVNFNGSQLSVQSMETANVTSGFRMRSNGENGRLRVAMANALGLGAGSDNVLRITFAIAPGTLAGTVINVNVGETRLYDISGALNATGDGGKVTVVALEVTPTHTPTPTTSGAATPTFTRTPTFTPTATTPAGTTATPTSTGGMVNPRSDINQDGVVDELDLFILLQDWRKSM